MNPTLTTREIQLSDISNIADYWLNASTEYLHSMGADKAKLPAREQWEQMLTQQMQSPYPEKKAYCIIWEVDGKAIGHCNVNNIIFGEEAYMHLHIWKPEARKMGYGRELVKQTLPYFFKNLQLQNLFCEPYALNPAPNKTLEKLGFELVKEYITTPGYINFEQPVKRWLMRNPELEKNR